MNIIFIVVQVPYFKNIIIHLNYFELNFLIILI